MSGQGSWNICSAKFLNSSYMTIALNWNPVVLTTTLLSHVILENNFCRKNLDLVHVSLFPVRMYFLGHFSSSHFGQATKLGHFSRISFIQLSWFISDFDMFGNMGKTRWLWKFRVEDGSEQE